MLRFQRRLMIIIVLASSACFVEPAFGQEWLTYEDKERHFTFEYPSAWQITTGWKIVAHYTDVFLTLNSAGKENFWAAEWGRKWEPISSLLPPGSVYFQIAFQSGPGPTPHQITQDPDELDLWELWKKTKTYFGKEGKSTSKYISFIKWGRVWSVSTSFVGPTTDEHRAIAEHILRSFTFDAVPVGHTRWAINKAHTHLPSDIERERFPYQGQHGYHWTRTEAICDEVLVTFGIVDPRGQKRGTVSERGGGYPDRIWQFRVTAKGEVIQTLEPR